MIHSNQTHHLYKRCSIASRSRLARRCRPCFVASRATTTDAYKNLPGPEGAFETGKESGARQKLFNSIAPYYDQLNGLLSLGQHWLWKQQTAKASGAMPGHKALDLCCGSGDIAILLSKLVGQKGQVVGLDFASSMLEDAAKREEKGRLPVPGMAYLSTPIKWIQGDATDLPFLDEEFDSATMGYGLRNVDDRPRALMELRRVLKPGAKVAILDFNNSLDPTVDAAQGWALQNIVVPAARVYGLEDEYAYLRPSIKMFPTGPEQEAMAIAAGFTDARHTELAFGLMGLLVCQK